MNYILNFIGRLIVISFFLSAHGKQLSVKDIERLITTKKNEKFHFDGKKFTKIAGFGPTSSIIAHGNWFWQEKYKIYHKHGRSGWHVSIENQSGATYFATVTFLGLPIALCAAAAIYKQYSTSLINNL